MTRTKSTYFALLAVLLTPITARADLLLEVDLTVPDTITVTATSGLSAATISGSDVTGFYLNDFFGASLGFFSIETSGDLTSALDTSDGTPILWHFSFDSGTGVNIFNTANSDPLDFIAGQTAFSGMATWAVSSDIYSAALAGAGAGDIYFPADDASDFSTAVVLGTWAVTSVPEPGTLALLGLGLIGMAVRRRKTV